MSDPKLMRVVPKVDYAIIGGSGTRDIRFPDALQDPAVRVLEDNLVFETPYGTSARFKLLEFTGEREGHVPKLALYARYHGWLTQHNRFEEQHRTFWVLEQAGVKRIVAEGSVGSVNPLLDPGDLVIPHDFIDFRTNVSKAFQEGKWVRLRQPLCSEVRDALVRGAAYAGFPRVFPRGVQAVTEGPRMETPAEIQMQRMLGCDIVGQSLTPEAYLARSIGACYAMANLVVNYGEGLVENWETTGLWDRYRNSADIMARALLEAAAQMGPRQGCLCAASVQERPADILNFPDK